MRRIASKWIHCQLLVLLLAVLLLPTCAMASDYSCTAIIPVQVNSGTDGEYTVQLEAVNDAPMPDQSSLTISGSGTGEFGPIEFTKPGDYCYLIYETPGDADYVTYDVTVYTVTVRVTNTEDGSLAAEVWAVREAEDQKTDQILFENSYDPPVEQPEDPDTSEEPTVADDSTTAPKTGDTSSVWMSVGTMVAAVVAFVMLVFFFGKQNQKQE